MFISDDDTAFEAECIRDPPAVLAFREVAYEYFWDKCVQYDRGACESKFSYDGSRLPRLREGSPGLAPQPYQQVRVGENLIFLLDR